MYCENGNKVVNFRKDGRYSFCLKKKIYKEYQDGLSFVDLSCKYRIGISTIHRWVDNFRNNRYNIDMKKKIDNKNTVLKIEEKGSPNQKSKHKYTIEELEKINKDLEKRIRKLELENQYIKKQKALIRKDQKELNK